MAKLALYKNHCTPQEQISSGGRYYLDSDCGRKLTGNNQFTFGSGSVGYDLETSVTHSAALLVSDKDFLFLKNTGDEDVFISFNGSSGDYHTVISTGEAVALELTGSNDIYLKTSASPKTSTVEYYTGT